MARQARSIRPGVFYHVLNRSAGRIALFRRGSDYAAVERIMAEAAEKFSLWVVDWLLSSESPRLTGGWEDWVNEPLAQKELARRRLSTARGMPYGSAGWVSQAIREMGLEHTVRAEGRPRKEGTDENSLRPRFTLRW